MDHESKSFVKSMVLLGCFFAVFLLTINLGFKLTDYHFPSKFDKLIHCAK